MNNPDETPNVLFIDDEEVVRQSTLQTLTLAGLIPKTYASAEAALMDIDRYFEGVVVSDIRMPGMDGLTFFKRLAALDDELPIILISGDSDIPTAVDAVKRGAYDFLSKPFSPDRLIDSIGRALKTRKLVLDNRRLRQQTRDEAMSGPLLGESDAIEKLRRTIDQIADINVSVLLEGETGTGKGIIASMLHDKSSRQNRQMVTIDCGALPDRLVDNELFGNVGGAYGVNSAARTGSLERANRSSLFLDAADSMTHAVQKKFELAIDRREVTPIGANMARPIDIRLITSSRSDLGRLVEAEKFSASLYYRLNGVTLKIPPLRRRREDIPILFGAFLSAACEKFQCVRPKLTPDIWQKLNNHDWPGNGRELHHYAERVALGINSQPLTDPQHAPVDLKTKMAEYEKALIEEALTSTGGETVRTHKLLNLPRKTLYDKMKRLGIDAKEFKASD